MDEVIRDNYMSMYDSADELELAEGESGARSPAQLHNRQEDLNHILEALRPQRLLVNQLTLIDTYTEMHTPRWRGQNNFQPVQEFLTQASHKRVWKACMTTGLRTIMNISHEALRVVEDPTRCVKAASSFTAMNTP
jgi:hypothetical protein